MNYQAIQVAANALYAALEALERELSAQPPDAVLQRESLRLTNTRLSIQKLLSVYSFAPLNVERIDRQTVVARAIYNPPEAIPPEVISTAPPTPGETLAAKTVSRSKGRR